MRQDEREREIRDEQPYFKTEREFQDANDLLFREWRNRFANEAPTDFDEWKVRAVMVERERVHELEGAFAKALKAWKYHAEDSDEFSAIVEAERVLLPKEQK